MKIQMVVNINDAHIDKLVHENGLNGPEQIIGAFKLFLNQQHCLKAELDNLGKVDFTIDYDAI